MRNSGRIFARFPPLFEPVFDLFDFGNFPGNFDNSINHQSRGKHHPIVANGFDILYLYDFRVNAQFLNRFLRSLLELIALGSTHSQHFNFLHVLLLSDKWFVVKIRLFLQGRESTKSNRPGLHKPCQRSWTEGRPARNKRASSGFR